MDGTSHYRNGPAMRPSVAVVIMSLCVTGCSRSPSVNVLGAYFPDWLFCIAAGVLFTIALEPSLLPRFIALLSQPRFS